jgi:cytochrome P450
VATTGTEPVTYPFSTAEGLDLDEAYVAAREAPGLVRVRLPFGEPAWLATRCADARLVLGDRRFSRAMALGRDAPRHYPPPELPSLLAMDPPEHTRLRRLVAKAFTARRVEELRPRIRTLAEGLIDELVAAGPPADLAETFALPLPVVTICELLGVPLADRARFQEWSVALFSISRLAPEQYGVNFQHLFGYIAELVAAHRAEPADDLMTALIEARDEHDQLSELELIGLCLFILAAGHETTASQLLNSVYALRHLYPQKWDELLADPALVPAAVEELTRFAPIPAGALFARYATEDVEVGGELVRAGEPVVVSVNAANRDAACFAGAEELRFDRPENPHLGFGHGAHHCLGAQLARVELQEGLRVLLDRLPGLRLAGDVVWKTENIVRGPAYLPVAW